MPSILTTFRTLPGTAAAVGMAGRHTVVVDRPDGAAGGLGLGFSGGQLLALAIGGCLCNDLRYVAQDDGIALGGIEVDVELTLDESHVTGAAVRVRVDTPDGADPSALVERAAALSTIGQSVQRGVPVTVTAR